MMPKMDSFISLSVPSLKGNELKYLADCIETNWVSSVGPYVDRFEREVAHRLGVPHAVACVNGTAALHVSLIAAGVQAEDEVIVPTVTFIAPVNAVRYVGACPVFMDCDDHLNMDAAKLVDFVEKECHFKDGRLLNRKTGRRVSAVIVVHVFGHPANMELIVQLTEKYGLKLIEDATESIGSYYKSLKGKKCFAGSIGDFGCLSFNGNKLITTGGGGMVLTNDEASARRVRHLTTQAKEDPLYFRHDEIGFNYRLTNLQAAVGVAQLEQLEKFIETKRKNFTTYRESLCGVTDLRWIEEPEGTYSNYWHYALVVDKEGDRDRLLIHLREKRIEARPLWALIHRQRPYQKFQAYRIEKALRYESAVLNIPCSVSLKEEEIQRVTEVIRSDWRVF